jgi:hypothetical protein
VLRPFVLSWFTERLPSLPVGGGDFTPACAKQPTHPLHKHSSEMAGHRLAVLDKRRKLKRYCVSAQVESP